MVTRVPEKKKASSPKNMFKHFGSTVLAHREAR